MTLAPSPDRLIGTVLISLLAAHFSVSAQTLPEPQRPATSNPLVPEQTLAFPTEPAARNQELPPPPTPSAPPSRRSPIVRSVRPMAAAQPPRQPAANILAWDATTKEISAKAGETNVTLAYVVTNISNSEVAINWLRPSCGCTAAKLPEYPYKLAPGTNVEISAHIDIRGKRGTLSKALYVDTTVGLQTLIMKVNIPLDAPESMTPDQRTINLAIAQADRQAVFKNDCASCHAEPAKGRTGEALYTAACAVCHDAEHRASFVPDLMALNHPTDRVHWESWIKHGKPGTLMPAFAQSEGGILDEQQIKSLVDYLDQKVSRRTATTSAARTDHDHPDTSSIPLPPPGN
ncbi:MAG TPA: c-type cytochrome [Methylomirabilota bacterium]|nr:c-type cytochrome [Methylomirabilota bacterium]